MIGGNDRFQRYSGVKFLTYSRIAKALHGDAFYANIAGSDVEILLRGNHFPFHREFHISDEHVVGLNGSFFDRFKPTAHHAHSFEFLVDVVFGNGYCGLFDRNRVQLGKVELRLEFNLTRICQWPLFGHYEDLKGFIDSQKFFRLHLTRLAVIVDPLFGDFGPKQRVAQRLKVFLLHGRQVGTRDDLILQLFAHIACEPFLDQGHRCPPLAETRYHGIPFELGKLLASFLVERVFRYGYGQLEAERAYIQLFDGDGLFELGHRLLFFGELSLLRGEPLLFLDR